MSFINSVKNFIGMDDDEYYDDEYMEDDEEEYEEEPRKQRFSSFSNRTSKVIPVRSQGANNKVRIIKPKSFEESGKIADEIKGDRLVIFDVTTLDIDQARRIVDFIVGSAYALNGNVRRVSGGIFVAAPNGIDISGDNLKEQTRSNFDWNV